MALRIPKLKVLHTSKNLPLRHSSASAVLFILDQTGRPIYALMCQKSIWAWACHHNLQMIVKCPESAFRGPCNGPITHNITQPANNVCYLCRLHNVHFRLKIHFKHVDSVIFQPPYAIPSMIRPFFENDLDMDHVPQIDELDNDEESSDPVFRANALQLWEDEKKAKQILSYKGRYGELEEFRTDAQKQRFEDGLWPQEPVEPNQYMDFNHTGPPPGRLLTQSHIGESIS